MNTATILVIDDCIELLDNTAEILKMKGYNVLTAENGKTGLEIATKNIPDLILCDIQMKGRH